MPHELNEVKRYKSYFSPICSIYDAYFNTGGVDAGGATKKDITNQFWNRISSYLQVKLIEWGRDTENSLLDKLVRMTMCYENAETLRQEKIGGGHTSYLYKTFEFLSTQDYHSPNQPLSQIRLLLIRQRQQYLEA